MSRIRVMYGPSKDGWYGKRTYYPYTLPSTTHDAWYKTGRLPVLVALNSLQECEEAALLREWDCNRNEPLTPSHVTHHSHIVVWWICAHGHSWAAAVKQRTGSQRTGCPICNASRPERLVMAVLKDYGSFEYDAAVCIGRPRPVHVDFKCGNVWIEYDGKQHFESIPHFGGNTAFVSQLERDRAKETYAKENGIFLLRIHHEQETRIRSVIADFFSHLRSNRIGSGMYIAGIYKSLYDRRPLPP